MDELIILSKKISKYVVGFEGNISQKLNNSFVIKASGKRLDNCCENDFVEFDFELNQLNNFNERGSMELEFHKLLLEMDGINFVCHTHPVNTLKILCSKEYKLFAKKRLFPDQVIFNGVKSMMVPYVKPGNKLSKKIKKKLNKFIKKNGALPKIILLKNHGLITFGNTIDECIIKTEICEKSAEIFCSLNNKSKKCFLNKKEILELVEDKKEKYRLSKL